MITEMNWNFSVSPVSSSLPLSRTKLVEDVLTAGRYGNINKVFLSRGHVFVLLDHQRKLVTFDTKPVDHIQEEEGEGCLDIDTEFPVIAVISLPSNAIYIILQNGAVQHWTYRLDCKWRLVNQFSICGNQGAEVTDVCFNVAQNALYWCEKKSAATSERPEYCIMMSKQSAALSGHDDGRQKTRDHGNSVTLLRNCPRSKVYPMGHGVLVVTESEPPMVSVCLLLCTLTGKIEIILGQDNIVSDLTTHSDADFKQILISCLNIVNKSKSRLPVKCSQYFHSTQTLVQVLADGQVVYVTTEKNKKCKCAQLKDFQADGIQRCMEVFGNLGILYDTEVRVYSLSNGRCLGTVVSPDGSAITGVCCALLGGHQTGFYTSSDLYILQRSKAVVSTDARTLLDGCTFQSDAIRLAFIAKIKSSVTNSSQSSVIDSMRENWMEMTGKPANSKLVEIVEPYLREYWNLENMLQDSLSKPENLPQLKQLSARDMVDHLLSPTSHISRSSRQAQLQILSHSHPDDVLDSVLCTLDLGSDELSTSQLQKWQCILTAENSDVAMSCDIAVPLFEQICHLLFKHRPDHLMVFLRRGQQVCDQKVGVSAFIRRRQTLQVYERALRCIPEPDQSLDQDAAVFVTVHLLLTSEVEGSLVKAVRLLLHYKKWSETMDLLQQNADKSTVYSLLYQMTLTALTQNEVLPQFADQIFSLMPSLQSCDNLSETKIEQADEEVFSSESNSISVDQVRPHLLKHMVDNDS